MLVFKIDQGLITIDVSQKWNQSRSYLIYKLQILKYHFIDSLSADYQNCFRKLFDDFFTFRISIQQKNHEQGCSFPEMDVTNSPLSHQFFP